MSHKNNSYNMESFTTAFLLLSPEKKGKWIIKIIQNITPSVMALPIGKTTAMADTQQWNRCCFNAMRNIEVIIIHEYQIQNVNKRIQALQSWSQPCILSFFIFILNAKDFYSIRFAIFPVSYPDFSLKISDTAFWHASEWYLLSTATGDTAWISSRKTR